MKRLALILPLLAGCPGAEEPVQQPAASPAPTPSYPPDYYEDAQDALKSATPDDTKFPFDPEGTNCPPNDEE